MLYEDLSKGQLINKIKELEALNKQLLDEKEQEVLLNFPWTGNLGHWYWNVQTNTVIFNPLKIMALGYTMEEVPESVPYQFFTDKIHPEDYQNTMNAMLSHLKGENSVYETEYRILDKNQKWKWFYDRGKITQRDNCGKPILVSGIVFDITEKKEVQCELELKNKLLETLSTTDGLTQLINHRTLMEHLKNEMQKAEYLKTPLSIALFDIDNFKQVNDKKGHVFGDEVLKNVASIMVKSVRDSDFVGRYGGEEFLAIFPNSTLEVASSVSNRIRLNIEAHIFSNDMKITVSGGVKAFCGEKMTDLIQKVDEYLYAAKKSGKNVIKY